MGLCWDWEGSSRRFPLNDSGSFLGGRDGLATPKPDLFLRHRRMGKEHLKQLTDTCRRSLAHPITAGLRLLVCSCLPLRVNTNCQKAATAHDDLPSTGVLRDSCTVQYSSLVAGTGAAIALSNKCTSLLYGILDKSIDSFGRANFAVARDNAR